MTQAIEYNPPEGMSLEANWADVVKSIANFAVDMRDKMESVQHKRRGLPLRQSQPRGGDASE